MKIYVTSLVNLINLHNPLEIMVQLITKHFPIESQLMRKIYVDRAQFLETKMILNLKRFRMFKKS